uniref:Uncharacterized protein n=1 Tax=Oryza brachyantha TaxID=4533 RepID=J3L0S2_ORYBR
MNCDKVNLWLRMNYYGYIELFCDSVPCLRILFNVFNRNELFHSLTLLRTSCV